MKKVSINKALCASCGFCYGNCSEVFGMNPDGTSKIIKPLVEDDNELVANTVDACPTGALSIETVEDNCECGDDCNCDDCNCTDCSCEK